MNIYDAVKVEAFYFNYFRYSMIDQECFEKKIEEWKTADPTLDALFRPKREDDGRKETSFSYTRKNGREIYLNDTAMRSFSLTQRTKLHATLFHCFSLWSQQIWITKLLQRLSSKTNPKSRLQKHLVL